MTLRAEFEKKVADAVKRKAAINTQRSKDDAKAAASLAKLQTRYQTAATKRAEKCDARLNVLDVEITSYNQILASLPN